MGKYVFKVYNEEIKTRLTQMLFLGFIAKFEQISAIG